MLTPDDILEKEVTFISEYVLLRAEGFKAQPFDAVGAAEKGYKVFQRILELVYHVPPKVEEPKGIIAEAASHGDLRW